MFLRPSSSEDYTNSPWRSHQDMWPQKEVLHFDIIYVVINWAMIYLKGTYDAFEWRLVFHIRKLILRTFEWSTYIFLGTETNQTCRLWGKQLTHVAEVDFLLTGITVRKAYTDSPEHLKQEEIYFVKESTLSSLEYGYEIACKNYSNCNDLNFDVLKAFLVSSSPCSQRWHWRFIFKYSGK